MQNQILKNWRRIKLREMGRVITGKTPPTQDKDSFGSEFPFITPTDIPTFNIRYGYTTDRFVSSKWWSRSKNMMVPRNSTCFVCIGSTIGKMCLVKKDSFTNQQINTFISDKTKIDPMFVFYLLRYRQKEIQKEFGGAGAAKPIVKKSTFEKIEFTIPVDIDEQKRISSLLSSLDDLIEINQEKIEILEEMAQAIFKEWFVEFRFPGYERVKMVDSEMGKIPESWMVTKIKNISQISRGISYGSDNLADEGLPFITINCIERGGGFKFEGLKHFEGNYKKTSVVRPNDIVVAVTDMTQARAIVGSAARIPDIGIDEGIVSMDLIKISPSDDITNEYLYSLLRFSGFSRVIKEYANGANVLHLNPKHIEEYQFVLPPNKQRRYFEIQIIPIFRLIDNLSKTNEILRIKRDLLLPKLISGEIVVSNLDILAIKN